jgi:hypothetical protein
VALGSLFTSAITMPFLMALRLIFFNANPAE